MVVDGIIQLFNLIKEAVKTKAGIFTLAVLFGFIPPATTTFIFYKESEKKEQWLDKSEQEVEKWQERAFNSDSLCIHKIENIANVFQNLESFYKEEDKKNEKNLNHEKSELNDYIKIKNQLDELNKLLENGK